MREVQPLLLLWELIPSIRYAPPGRDAETALALPEVPQDMQLLELPAG
jgi:hypothetical protein